MRRDNTFLMRKTLFILQNLKFRSSRENHFHNEHFSSIYAGETGNIGGELPGLFDWTIRAEIKEDCDLFLDLNCNEIIKIESAVLIAYEKPFQGPLTDELHYSALLGRFDFVPLLNKKGT